MGSGFLITLIVFEFIASSLASSSNSSLARHTRDTDTGKACDFPTQTCTPAQEIDVPACTTCENYCKSLGKGGGYCHAHKRCYCTASPNLKNSDIKLCTEKNGAGTCVEIGTLMAMPYQCIPLQDNTDPALQAMDKNVKSIIYRTQLCFYVYPSTNCNKGDMPHAKVYRTFGRDLPFHTRAFDMMGDLQTGGSRWKWPDGVRSIKRDWTCTEDD